jgi:hypothetical protein
MPFAIIPHTKIGVLWYYFDILYPAQFLVIGLLIQTLLALCPKTPSGKRMNSGLQLPVAGVVGAIVVVQVWFIVSFEKAVEQSGIFRLTGDIVLSAPDLGTRGLIEAMPLRDVKALAKRFLDRFGVDYATLEQRAHGAMYQLFREDKGFLFQTVSPRTPTPPSDPTLHYLILRDDLQATLEQRHEANVGAYRIVAYHPAVRYESWRWSVSPEPGWWSPMLEDSAWPAVVLPARKVPDLAVYTGIPYTQWPGKTVVFRGWMEGSAVTQPVWLVLTLRDSHFFPHEIGAFYVNGQLLRPVRTIAHNSFNSRNIEVVVDVTTALRSGSNLLAFEITGINEEFDLDLYELWPAHAPR